VNIKKSIILIAVISGLLAIIVGCGSSSSDPYSSVSVAPLSLNDVAGEFDGSAVASEAQFEEEILGPLLGGELSGIVGAPVSRMLSSVPVSASARTMETFVDDQDTIDEEIDLVNDIDESPFTSGTISLKGSYKVFGQAEDVDPGDVVFNLNSDLETVVDNAVSTIDNNGTDYKYTISGKANVNAVADFSMDVSGSDPDYKIVLGLDYGIAYSAALLISVDDNNDGTDDYGALVVVNLKFSKSNHNTYYQSDYDSEDAALEDMLNDSIPDTASLDITVYNNDREKIFEKSYDLKDLVSE